MNRTSEAVLAALYAKRPQVIKPGLERIRAALPYLDRGELATPSVLIGGTNGKGTTTAFLAQLLAAGGARVGVFTSPHLEHFCERIQILGDGASVLTDDDLVAAHAHLQARLPQALYEVLSFFEVTTLLGLAVFREHGTTINLMEVGLGGRFDSTNVIEPMLSIITSIGLDHQEFLGETTAKIAMEKAGIMRRARPVVLGGSDSYDAAAAAVLKAEAERIGAEIYRIGAEPLPASLPASWRCLPPFLDDNLRKALLAYALITGGASIDAVRLAKLTPLATVRARFERLSVDGVELLLDVCHNPAGAAAFAQALAPALAERGGERFVAMMTMFTDKDCDTVLDRLRTVLGSIHLFPQQSERTWTRARLAARHQDLPWHPDLARAFAAAKADLAGTPGPLIVCGSVHGMGEVLRFLQVSQNATL